MDKLFKEESGFMRFLNKLAQIMGLNLLILVCFLPVLTGGAAVTAAYDVLWRGKELENGTWKTFWRSFRGNFKQATVLWLIFLVTGAMMGYCLWFMLQNSQAYSPIMLLVLLLAAVLWAMTAAWVFPLQSRFQNSIFGTVRTGILFAIGYLPKSLMMALLNLFPILLYVFNPRLFFFVGWLFLLLWFGFTAFMNTHILRPAFEATIRQLQQEEASQ